MSKEVPQNPDPPAASLWDWSVACYGQPGLAEAALDLQDRHGLDVNLLLYALWLALVPGRRLDLPAASRARAATESWQQSVVVPLRRVRRALKLAPHPDARFSTAFRQQVAADELEAERGEQALLAGLPLPAAVPLPDGERLLDLAAHNLLATGLAADARIDASLTDTLGRLLAAATGEPLAEAAAALSRSVDA
jgi:uncharacterized protein (TIGR02444 family)